MIFHVHNFNHNFSNFIQSGDMEITKDLLINEIHSIINKDKPVVVSLLNAAKVPADVKEKNKSIWDKLFNNMSNPLIRDGIANLIVKHNEKKSGADAVTTAPAPSPTLATIGLKTLDTIKSALDLFGGSKTPPEMPSSNSTTYAEPKKSNTLLYVGIGVAVLAIGYYVYTKNKK